MKRILILGDKGTGKTTLMNILAKNEVNGNYE